MPMPMLPENRGSIIVRNTTGSPYAVQEMGGTTIAPGAELDLLSEAVAGRYTDYEAANRLVTALPTAQLYQDIQAGTIVIVANIPRDFGG